MPLSTRFYPLHTVLKYQTGESENQAWKPLEVFFWLLKDYASKAEDRDGLSC